MDTSTDLDYETDRINQKMRHRFVMQMLRYGHLHGGKKRAAIAAGYSERTASEQASRLLADPEIQKHLGMEKEKLAEKCDVTPQKIVNRLAQLAFADVADLATWEGNQIDIRDSADLCPSETVTIAKISETKIKGGGRKIEIQQHDPLAALKLLGQTLAMFQGKVTDPTAQIGGVLRVPSRQNVEEWEEEQAQEDVQE